MVAMSSLTTRLTPSTLSGCASFARSARTWKDMIDSAPSSIRRNSSAGCERRNESGSSPPGSDTTRTGTSAASSSRADFTVALRPAASSS